VREFEELYDYDVLRQLSEPTLFSIRLDTPTIVLGSSQPSSVLREDLSDEQPIRRRRGGGGVVLLQPDDLWLDFWIPRNDDRWTDDVTVASCEAGRWWSEALTPHVNAPLTMHREGLIGDDDIRVACFAGKGPGELFVGDAKVVGVTQWRVREGMFLSTVLHARSSAPLIDFLSNPVDGLAEALHHETAPSIGLDDPDAVIDGLRRQGNWRFRQLFLTK
jgi:lipoate-protein ligase A